MSDNNTATDRDYSLEMGSPSNDGHCRRRRIAGVWLCAIITAAAMLVMYLRCSQTVLMGDDLFYRYILPAEELTTPNIGERVSSLGDALESQSNQYFHTNGRFLVHIVVQLLAGSHPGPGFAIVSALLLGFILTAFIRYTLAGEMRRNPLWWILAATVWFYMFPASDHLWYEIATGMNYLLPMALTLGWLLAWRGLSREGALPSWAAIAGTAALGFVAGWSQEGFAVPLAGAMSVYAIVRRKSLSKRAWIPLALLWAGTAIMVLAPGNRHRLSDGAGLAGHLVNAVNLYFQIRIIWVAVCVCIAAFALRRRMFLRQVREDAVVWLSLGIAMLFGIIANTYAQSYTGIEFFSLIICFRQLNLLNRHAGDASGATMAAATVLLILFAVHQGIIIHEGEKIERYNNEFIARYAASGSGVMTLETPPIHPLARPWMNMALYPSADWALYSLNVAYAGNTRPIVLITKEEEAIFDTPSGFYTPGRRIDGNANAYRGSKIWIPGAHREPVTATLIRSDRSPMEKIINRVTGQTGKTFTTKLQPKHILPVSGSDSVTVYPLPSFRIVSVDFRP